MHIYYYEFLKNNSFHISPLLRKYEICNSDINTPFYIPYHFVFNLFQQSSQLTHIIFQYILHIEKLPFLALSCVRFSQASRLLSTLLTNDFREAVHSHKLC